MFFDDATLTPRKRATLRATPPIPSTGWIAPREFPNLSAAKIIGLDCETKETDFKNGPGWGRGQGHIVGVSLAVEAANGEQAKWYFPARHEVEPEYNLDPANVFGWLKSVLETNVPKVGANLLYDIGWLTTENIRVGGSLEDTQFAEALIDEFAFVALDAMAHKYLGVGKTSTIMYDWLREAYPDTPVSETRGDIFRCPPRLVGFYAEDDAHLPIDIIKHQRIELEQQELTNLFRLECDLILLLIRMRLEGVSVDVGKALELQDELELETKLLYRRILDEYRYDIKSVHSNQLGPLFKKVGIDTPITDAGNPSIKKEWLANLEHPLGEIVRDIREREKICGTFIKSYIVDKSVPTTGSNSIAKIFPQFHPLKGDEKGTKVGRFSSSDPNLQNIPTRTVLGKKIRGLFVPDAGHFNWKKLDYSQIHYRILAHFAIGPGSEELRQRYINDKKTDYHRDVLFAVAPLLGWDTTDEKHNDFVRRPIKNVNFGLLYGQSLRALSNKIADYFGEGFTAAQVKGFFDAYFKGAPYIKPTMKMIGEEVQTRGFTTSILGRRCRFNLWEPAIRGPDWSEPLQYNAAIREYGNNIKRAYEYRGVNYKFQSSEPDIMKTGMLNCLKSGVFDITGVPRLTVHDELDFSVRDDTKEMREAFDFIQHTMENAVQLRVPVFVDVENGPNWGNVD